MAGGTLPSCEWADCMDKGRKLRKYRRKDYTQVVDFPVEIVGRDGVVRRYTFEESIRLYHRRIASAGSRYQDPEVAEAEKRHCSQRIGQLRRSFFARHGWEGLRVVDSPQVLAGEFAGEVAAFVRRCIDDLAGDTEVVESTFLQDAEDHQIYFVQRLGNLLPRHDGATPEEFSQDAGCLLYLYRFGEPGGCPARESFFAFLRLLQDVRGTAEGVEALVAFHHTADLGLVLTGPPELAHQGPVDQSSGNSAPVDASWLEPQEDADALRQAMAHLRRGERVEALGQFSRAYEANPYRRSAYLGAAVVADQIGSAGDAETAALMGIHHFPDDIPLHYHLVLSRLRRGAIAEASAALRTAPPAAGHLGMALLQALSLLAGQQMWQGTRALRKVLPESRQEGGEFEAAVRAVRFQLVARWVLRCLGWTSTVGGLVAAFLGWTPFLLVTGAGALLLLAAQRAWHRQFMRLVSLRPSEGLRLSSPVDGQGTPADGDGPRA